jgi:serine/threonine protein kinase
MRRSTLTSSPSTPIKEGWLRKQCGFFKSWKPLYFVLQNTSLSYFPKPGGKRLGQILLGAARVIITAPECRRQPAFKISLAQGRTYYFVSESADEIQSWITALENIRLGRPVVVRAPPKRIGADDFEVIRLIGRGTYGKVQLVRHRADGKLYAMKTMGKQILAEYEQIEQVVRERDVLLRTVHPFLVGAHWAFQNDASVFLVLDYVPGGELYGRLKEEKRFAEPRARLYAAEILLGLGHLHALGFVYRDLKPENILVDSEGHLRLTDFGLVKMMVGDQATTSTFCGTPEYLAPEMIQHMPYTKAVDWWSYGCIVYELLVGLPPFYNENKNRMYREIMNGQVTFPQFVSPNAKDLILGLLDRNPVERLGGGEDDFREIQGHPFFAGLNWSAVERRQIRPEWAPMLKTETDVSNFDQEFTAQAVDWPDDVAVVGSSTQSAFQGFTLVSQSRL